jgi:hypothetical protein
MANELALTPEGSRSAARMSRTSCTSLDSSQDCSASFHTMRASCEDPTFQELAGITRSGRPCTSDDDKPTSNFFWAART